MRLAFLANNFAGVGHHASGVGNYLARLAPLLAARGHECEIFCNAEGLKAGSRPIAYAEGITVHVAGDDRRALEAFNRLPPGTPWSPLAPAWLAARAASARHRERPFDIVQVTNFQPAALFLEVDVPVVMRMSSYSPQWRAAEQHGSADPRVPLEWYVEFLLEREAIGASDAWYAPSQLLCDRYRETLKIDVALVRPPAYAELEAGSWDQTWYRAAVADRTPYLAFVNAVNRRKGGHILAGALPRFFAACPDVHLHVLGQPLDCLDLICADTTGARRPNVHYHGVGGHDRVYPLLAGAMGLVFPSLIDNLPNTVIESLTLGVPAVVTAGSSADELVQDGESGFVVPQNDPDRLADAMIRLVHTAPHERAAMGARGRASIRQLLEPERAARDLERFLQSVQARPRPRRLDAEQTLRSIASSVRDYYALGGQAGAERQKREAFAPLVASLIVDRVERVAVYGAGEAGQLLARELALHGIHVSCFIESNSTQWGHRVRDVDVVSLDRARANGVTVVAIGSIAWAEQIAEQIAGEAARTGWRPRVYGPASLATGDDRSQSRRIA